jgi:pimeloyl-ACP methyl ester carboxylesterase
MTRFVCLAVTVALLGCGDDDDDDGAPPDAAVDAASDAAGQDGVGDGGADAGEPGSLEWTACDDLECASLDVPIDHRDPEGPTLSLSVIRRTASAPAERIGALVVNFAGESVPAARQMFPMIALLAPDVADLFDLVAFDPRGWGGSAPIDCVDDDTMEALLASDLTPDDEADWTATMELLQALSDGCAARSADRIAFIDSESSARDMDLLRAAMGDEQVSFLGISYGTLLGAMYGTLFPERVRAFILDSPVAPAQSAVEFVVRQADASETELARFFAGCGADATCAFHGGEGETAVQDAFDALVAGAEEEPIAAGDESLTASLVQAGTVAQLRNGDWEALGSALADAAAGDGAALFGPASAIFGRNGNGTWNNFLEVFEPAVILDLGCPDGYDLAAAQATAADLATHAPRVGAMAATASALCATWTLERPTARTPMDASEAPPMLVFAGRHDQSTPYEFVPSLMDALGNDSYLVTWEGTGHGVSNRTICTITATVEFVMDPATAPAVETCPAESLPLTPP